MNPTVSSLLDDSDFNLFRIATHGPGPIGRLPFTESMLLDAPSGDLFGMTHIVESNLCSLVLVLAFAHERAVGRCVFGIVAAIVATATFLTCKLLQKNLLIGRALQILHIQEEWVSV